MMTGFDVAPNVDRSHSDKDFQRVDPCHCATGWISLVSTSVSSGKRALPCASSVVAAFTLSKAFVVLISICIVLASLLALD